MAAGAVALVAIVYVFMVRLPLAEEVERLRERRGEDRELVAWMEQAVAEIQERSGDAAPSGTDLDGSLYSEAEQRAREAGLGEQLQRVEPAGDAGARLDFEGIAFDTLVDWLLELRDTHGIRVAEATIRRGEDSGRVDARLRLEPR